MSRPVLVFLGAVLVPSLVLGGLALRAVQGQEALLERQRFRLHEAAADHLSHAISLRIDEHQRDFSLRVESLIGKDSPATLARNFDDRLRPGWSLANVGFAVSLTGQVYSPYILGNPEGRQFLVRNELFLCQQASVEVFAVTPKGKINLDPLNLSPFGPAFPETPQDNSAPGMGTVRFKQLVADAQEGVVARFQDDQLMVWLWYRTPRDPEIIFGAQLDPQRLRADLQRVVAQSAAPPAGAALALLDDRGDAVATIPAASSPDWKHPVALRPVGAVLPHWTVAAALTEPRQVLADSRRLQLTLGAVVTLLIAAIGFGGWRVIGDARRQLDLARKKSDFVSNVSHELRTPLTSIRLFAEMLADGRIIEESRRREHLGVIQTEAARLDRLITNVLDFARLDRGHRQLRREAVDLGAVAGKVMHSFQPQIATEGLVACFDAPPFPILVSGDADALAQVIHNLLSNAVKYAAGGRYIELRVTRGDEDAVLEVLDRGTGVPRGCEQRVFEQFFRGHDSLSSGIPGAGLGLTLARQIARAHGGDVDYHPREGGGSCFRLRLRLRALTEEADAPAPVRDPGSGTLNGARRGSPGVPSAAGGLDS